MKPFWPPRHGFVPSRLPLLKTLLSRLPVHYVPNGLEVFGLAILVIKAAMSH